ncbi:MAG: AsmA family protein [Variovorax sp.]|nr:MAG: AsmA family protein [Variovorax sp.]
MNLPSQPAAMAQVRKLMPKRKRLVRRGEDGKSRRSSTPEPWIPVPDFVALHFSEGLFPMAPHTQGLLRRHPVCFTVATLVVVLITFLLLFDWNWVRPAIERYVSKKTEREFRMSDLHVKLGLAPTIRMRDVYFGNAAWSKSEPTMAKAEAVEFSVSLRDRKKSSFPGSHSPGRNWSSSAWRTTARTGFFRNPPTPRRASCASARCRSIRAGCATLTTASPLSLTSRVRPSIRRHRRRRRTLTPSRSTTATPPSTTSRASTTTRSSPAGRSRVTFLASRSPVCRSR